MLSCCPVSNKLGRNYELSGCRISASFLEEEWLPKTTYVEKSKEIMFISRTAWGQANL